MESLSKYSAYIKPHSPKTSQSHLWSKTDDERDHLEGRKMGKCPPSPLCDDLVMVIKTESSRYIFTTDDTWHVQFLHISLPLSSCLVTSSNMYL